ncbi:tyrosine-protein kinase-like isoform X2 [Convolutriloba macropyga]|uniref:tyrosine-protein kinase-like isoform X2 n=1 Tax=Convolutriloba macropyga TaxID=536237 RepID=UPI003F51ADA9
MGNQRSRESIIDATTTLKADSQSSSAYNSRNRRKRQSTNHISSLYSRDMTNKDSKQDNRSRDRKDPKLKEVSNNNTRSRTPDSNRSRGGNNSARGLPSPSPGGGGGGGGTGGSRSQSRSRSREEKNQQNVSNNPSSNDQSKRPGPGTRKPPSPGNVSGGGNSSMNRNNLMPSSSGRPEDEQDQHMYANAGAENEYDYTHVGFKEGKLYYAMFDYKAQTDFHLSFKRGDRLVVVDQSKPEWWMAIIGLKKGYVPSNYLCVNTLTLGPWYFKDCKRNDAERLLMKAGAGSYLIRNRDRLTKSSLNRLRTEYTLSVKVEDGTASRVQHWKIDVIHSLHQAPNSQADPTEESNLRYYIDKRKRFKSLAKLVKYYSRHKELEVLLKEPCVQDQPSAEGMCLPGLKDKWEIPKEEVTFHKVLGSGQFGEVWRGRWNNILDVAVKILKSESTMKIEEFLMEARVMKQLHHKHLVQLYAVCSESEPMYIITELAEHGSLKDFLQKDAENLNTEFLTGIAGDIASGMSYLESKDFIHRDLAARNVVVGRNTVCKICDFGLARWLTTDFYQARRGSKFPVRWTAPEAMLKGKFTIKSDVWSFGVLCYEIITKGQTPYKGMSNKEVMQFVMKENKLTKPAHCPDWYYEVMTKCWRKEADTRPSFRRILKVIHKNCADEIANSLDASDAEKSSAVEN